MAHYLVPAVRPGVVHVTGPEGRHAAAVRRSRVGETVVLMDGAGTWAAGPVTTVGKDTISVDCVLTGTEPRTALRVTVVQALPKGERSDLAVDLVTEAGADRIVPWAAERCVARWTGDKASKGTAKWRTVAQQAAKQARRSWIPEVSGLAGLDDVVRLVTQADAAWVLHETASRTVHSAPLPERGELVLVIGPEGGVTPGELDRLTRAGAVAVRLGPQVLRTSTAGAVALGALGALRRW